MSELDLNFLKDEKLQKEVSQWLQWETNQDDLLLLSNLIQEKDVSQITKMFSKRIQFGTSGLRARMSPGPGCINHLTVQQTTQGLSHYLLEREKDAKERGVVIGFDARHRSEAFARITAGVFVSQGFKVFLYRRIVPTPFIPFGVTYHKAVAGVMITASHNPKDDNGYKLYWGNGCLIVSPHEKNISDSILAHLDPWDLTDSFKQVDTQGGGELVNETLEEVADAYYSGIKTEPYCWFPAHNAQAKTRVTFTPVHGVGQEWVERAFSTFSLPPLVPVEEQMKPDPNFSTVKFPNPEEGKGVLSLAIEAANRHNSLVILANDPDSDRCALAEKNKETGEWRTFTGDELGGIFGAWIWERYRESASSPSEYAVIATAVSSRLLQRIAEVEGIQYHETLTGFKYLGNKARTLLDEGHKFIFAYEESIGYLPGPLSLDKDGVRTAAMLAEMTIQLYEHKNQTFESYLDGLYKKYGYFMTSNRYFFCYDPKLMGAIFEEFRTKNQGKYPEQVGDYKIKYIRDLTVGYDNQQKENKPILPVSATSQMITITFEEFQVDGETYKGIATIRGSGTEPKLKYYVEAMGFTSKSKTQKAADLLAQSVIQTILRPEENGLSPPHE
mmetsp:Transcript_8352/g.11229  ORF Transcript_8352/g.11229 Transcript_8352/m.11229 type:complete len:614 (+) Transcript_8352:64-1905(+)|eukprot:CAMPEP_0201488038 /NCGR_PEP_ID=MMETSP0151_2-20130828/16504_1 /ASSEMBLY_ACC=CAM_ASM_000257 /TAXON_ID=200890 /ORGANISM="Paramoeba atlantica, Strain 621/1 / CCAP 1560/9" /LENGTH=613 /DNA_ID=CAMNT_0047873245 /DNA_START=64 /DNA_END=1905 /DNA_ORIENTATION=+